MSSKCRSILIETICLSDECLSLIGKSLSETLRVAINRVTERPTITHLITYLVDIQTTQISRLLAIKSKEFAEYLPKISNLKRPTKKLVPNQNSCHNVANLLKEVKESLNGSKELNKTELTYISGRDVEELVDDFAFAFNTQQIDSSFLSQINIVLIKRSGDPNVVYGPTPSTFTEISGELQALLEIQTIEENEFTIDGYFKVWLHDITIQSERVRIYLSPKTGQHSNGNSNVIKCDLREAIIDLNRLSIDKSGKKLNSSQIEVLKSLPNICETIGCYELQLLGLISRLGLCESVLFGIPFILSATRCPNLDFNELMLNCKRFDALIEILNEKNAVIVLELSNKNNENNCLKNPFVVMPSADSKSLIMKAIATKELVLPTFTDSVDTMVAKTSSKSEKDSMRRQLNDFPFADIYNPLFIANNLFNILKN